MALIAEYGFAEGIGTTAADTSGNGRTLTINSGSWSGTAVTGQFASTSAIYATQPAQGTIMCKARFDSAPSETALLGGGASGSGLWRGAEWGNSGGKITFVVYDGGAGAATVGGTSTIGLSHGRHPGCTCTATVP